MVATVLIGQKNGTAGTFEEKSASGTIRFKNAENSTVDTSDPMVIPTAGNDWSYEVWTRLKVTVAPDTNISNLKFYTDGANGFGTGVSMWARNRTAYAQPGQPDSAGGFVDAFGYTAAGALALSGAAETFTGTGEKGEHAVLLLQVASTATQGTLTAETLTYSYDEL